MKIEYIIYIAEVIIMIILLFKFVPKNKIREAHVAYLFKLVLTWILGEIVAEYRLIEYPIRLFPHANKASFLFEFFLYPAICALFVVHYPEEKSLLGKFMYYSYFCTSMTIIEVIQERYTDILEYRYWAWYITWISLFITFYFSRKYNVWFFKNKNIANTE